MDLPSVPSEAQFGGIVSDIVIEDYVVVGAHSCILPGARLPRGSAFGAFSLIRPAQYRAFGLHAGIPATFRKHRSVPDDVPERFMALARDASGATNRQGVAENE